MQILFSVEFLVILFSRLFKAKLFYCLLLFSYNYTAQVSLDSRMLNKIIHPGHMI